MNDSTNKYGRATIGRKELEREIHERYGIPRCHVETVVRAFLGGMAQVLAEGGRCEFRNVGVFDTRISRRKAKENPMRPGQVVPAKTEVKVTFKAGKRLSEMVQRLLDGERSAA